MFLLTVESVLKTENELYLKKLLSGHNSFSAAIHLQYMLCRQVFHFIGIDQRIVILYIYHHLQCYQTLMTFVPVLAPILCPYFVSVSRPTRTRTSTQQTIKISQVFKRGVYMLVVCILKNFSILKITVIQNFFKKQRKIL